MSLAQKPARRKKFFPPQERSLTYILVSMVGQMVRVELKNDCEVTGVLDFVDKFMNIELRDVVYRKADRDADSVTFEDMFVKGMSIRYVFMPSDVDIGQHLLRYHIKKEKLGASGLPSKISGRGRAYGKS